MHKIVNGQQIELTPEEIAEHQAREQAWENAKEDRAWKQLRRERDQLLKDSDWTQIPDCTVDKTVWATYRQELRDITSQEGFPFNITFPAMPE